MKVELGSHLQRLYLADQVNFFPIILFGKKHLQEKIVKNSTNDWFTNRLHRSFRIIEFISSTFGSLLRVKLYSWHPICFHVKCIFGISIPVAVLFSISAFQISENTVINSMLLTSQLFKYGSRLALKEPEYKKLSAEHRANFQNFSLRFKM